MHSSSSSLRRSRSFSGGSAFTLIELLTVITIIAVLAGLLLPVVGKVTENARKVSAKSTETQIVTAVNSYMTEYGQYPVDPTSTTMTSTPTTDTTFGTDNHNSMLFEVLRNFPNTTSGTLTALNIRHVVYFESKSVKNNLQPRDGFIVTAGGTSNNQAKSAFNIGDLVDPWGNTYFVRIDTGYSGSVENPYKDASLAADDTTASSTPIDTLRNTVIAFSYGADGIPGSLGNTPPPSPYAIIGDDVISWQ